MSASPLRRSAVVDLVLDPDGTARLLRIDGHASVQTIDRLDALTSTSSPHTLVHVDLLDAVIEDEPVVHRLEEWADRLETSFVRVRMVGLDPEHPAPQTSRSDRS